jgi:hypothetical protein
VRRCRTQKNGRPSRVVVTVLGAALLAVIVVGSAVVRRRYVGAFVLLVPRCLSCLPPVLLFGRAGTPRT